MVGNVLWYRAIVGTLLVLFLLPTGCKKDEDNNNNVPGCGPRDLTLEQLAQRMSFYYDDTGKPISLAGADSRIDFKYDAQGRLVRIEEFSATNMQSYRELTYTSAGLPDSLKTYGVGITPSPHTIQSYEHDGEGRLVKRRRVGSNGVVVNQQRFEYEGDNFKRSYFSTDNLPEWLARENLTFDTHERFFANSEALKIFCVYFISDNPGKNNILTSNMYDDFLRVPSPQVSYEVEYDAQGRTKTWRVQSGSAPYFDFTFSNASFYCE